MYAGVINYRVKEGKKRAKDEKWAIEDTHLTRESALKEFNVWAEAYRISVHGEPEVIMYAADLSRIAAEYEQDKVGDFYKRIASDDRLIEYRNPIYREYWLNVWQKLDDLCHCNFSNDPIKMENYLISHILQNPTDYDNVVPYRSHNKIRDSYSVKQLAEIVLGKSWADDYQKALAVSMVQYMIERFYQLRRLGLEGKSIQEGSIQEVIEKASVRDYLKTE